MAKREKAIVLTIVGFLVAFVIATALPLEEWTGLSPLDFCGTLTFCERGGFVE